MLNFELLVLVINEKLGKRFHLNLEPTPTWAILPYLNLFEIIIADHVSIPLSRHSNHIIS